METCFGLLTAEHSEDSVRVGLTVDDAVLKATEVDGSSWDIALDRVHLTAWSAEELRLELAGETVFFVPEDPDATLASLVPAVLSRQERSVAAPGARTSSKAIPPPAEPGLTVDLTEVTPSAARPSESRRPPASPVQLPRPPRRQHQRHRLVLSLLAVITVIALGGWALTQTGSTNPAEAAREVLATNGFPAVSISTENGIATLTGSVATPDEADRVVDLVAGVGGIEEVTNELAVLAPGTSEDPPADAAATDADSVAEAAQAALRQAGIAAATLEIESGTAAITGTVASEADRRSAGAVLLAMPQIDRVDNLLEVTSRPDDAIEADARGTLDAAGFGVIGVSSTDGVVSLTGAIPQDGLGDGVFAFSDQVEARVLSVEGVSGIRNRLQLAGDEATLRRQLRDLTDETPVVFALGQADLTAASQVTLERAAGIIQGQPGLRVLIAGHTDTTGSVSFNEALSRDRAGSVRAFLIERGIAVNRLLVVAYGELFPSGPGDQPADRRVVFEVAG